MNHDRAFIHIGLHKAGSTFLQNSIWPAVFPDTSLLQKHATASWAELSHAAETGTADHSLMLSKEQFSGTIKPATPGESWSVFQRFVDTAKRIEPKPRVLLVVRPHATWCWSAYIELRKKRWTDATFAEYLSSFSEADLSWSQRISALRHENFPLLVVRQDELQNDTEQTVSGILRFIGYPITQPITDRIHRPAANTNRSPTTHFSMKVSRSLYTRPGKATFRISNSIFKRIPGIRRPILDRESARNKLIDWIDNYWHYGPIRPEPLPDKLAAFARKDWEETLRIIK